MARNAETKLPEHNITNAVSADRWAPRSAQNFVLCLHMFERILTPDIDLDFFVGWNRHVAAPLVILLTM